MSSSDEGEAHAGARKRFQLHQIEVLDSVFGTCSHPDENHRIDLGRRLGLTPQQIKFWFQNKRNQIKAQSDKLAYSSLRAENEKLRRKTIEIQKALKKCICSQEEEESLRLANECTKTKIDQCIDIITKQLGSTFSETSLIQSPLDDLSTAESTGSSLLPINTPFSVSDKPLLIEQATNAMTEFIMLVQTNDQLWNKPMHEDKEIFDVNLYRKLFRKIDHHFTVSDIRVEASRASGLVCMDPVALVHMFMNTDKWTDLFQTVVSKAKVFDVLSLGMGGNNYSGSFLLMHSVFEIPSPLIPSREYYFIRYCQLVENGLWCMTDVSVDLPGYSVKNRRLPSGCLIQEMPNGYSKVTWLEHLEVEENGQNLDVIQNFVNCSMAFGAQRWLSTLQRMTERLHHYSMSGPPNVNIGGVTMTEEIKKSMMTLSNSMVKSFCSCLSPANKIALLDDNEFQIRVLPYKISDNVIPDVMILHAIFSTWLPLSTESIFIFFKDKSNRELWDTHSIGNIVQQPITNINTGLNTENCVSLLRAVTSDKKASLILQETSTDSSITMLVYASVDDPSMEIMMCGGDVSNISLIPSGVAILPDSNVSSGSFVTLSFQIRMDGEDKANINLDMLKRVESMMSDVVRNMKTALNLP